MNGSNQTVPTKRCAHCKLEKPLSSFYKRSGLRSGYNAYCKSCNNETRIARTRKNKHQAVKLLGGKCKRCGFNKCEAALHFHHPDPSIKDDMFHRLRNRKWEHIAEALTRQGCELLCANCHAAEHCQNQCWAIDHP